MSPKSYLTKQETGEKRRKEREKNEKCEKVKQQ